MIWEWTPQFITAQVLGVLVIICCVIMPHSKTKSRLLMWNIIANALIIAEMLILGRNAAAATALVAIVRSIIFYAYTKRKQRSPRWVMWMLVVVHLAGVFALWNGWMSMLLLFGAFITCAQWQDDLRIMRWAIGVVTIPLGFYNIFAGAYTGAANEWMQSISAFIALLTNRRRRDTVET